MNEQYKVEISDVGNILIRSRMIPISDWRLITPEDLFLLLEVAVAAGYLERLPNSQPDSEKRRAIQVNTYQLDTYGHAWDVWKAASFLKECLIQSGIVHDEDRGE